ncbi:MAG TPA: hypothetical protein VLA93_18540 [Pyrinomonadaceae bacterium]|nr:hypothetical protein [Pyrinomonadaceae bacterium]
MKLVSLIVFLAVFPVSANAQCTQKISDLPAAPELFGFHLGMTKEQVKTLVPQVHFGKTDDFGVSKTTINPGFDPKMDASKFADVRSISLELFDEHVTSIWIGFEESYKIRDLTEFAGAISKSLRLPNSWSAYRSRGHQMRCADFQLIATTVARAPSLKIMDLSADDAVASRRQAKEEQDAAVEAATENGGAEDTSVIADKKTKNYYPIACDAAKAISPDNRLVFKNAEEAAKAGFKIGKGCE